jgi:hypothetical protein
MTTLTPTSRVSIPEHVHAREFDGELVILDLDKGCYFGLDEVGTRVWQLMTAGATVAQVVEQLVPEYDATSDRMLQDFLSLGNEWLERGLVQLREDP